MTESLNKVIQRNLQQLKNEMSAYTNEEDIWKLDGEILNTAGNLCLHLCGNLQHFIGAVLGKSGYVRQRDAEFSTKNVPVSELLILIDTTMEVISSTLSNLDNDSLARPFPENISKSPMTTEHMLIHLTSHLGYHLGQLNYHRRLIATN